MEITVNKSEFTKAITIAARFISPRAQLPILGNIVIKAQKTRVYLSATNLEMSYSHFLAGQITTEGEIAVPGRVVAELMPNVAGDNLQISVQKESLQLITDGFSSTIAAMNTNDFPVVPHELTESAITLPAVFIDSLKKVIFSCGVDDARPVLTGVLFLFSKDLLTLVSSDGSRLSRISFAIQSELEEKVIIPRSILSEVLKIYSGGTVSFEKKLESQVLFGIGNTILGSRCIDGEFPNFERIIPKTTNTSLDVAKGDLKRSLALSAVFARDNGNKVKLTVSEQDLHITALSQKTGTQESSIAANVQGVGGEVPFNYRFIDDFISCVEGDRIIIKLNDGSSPGMFEDPASPEFLHLIMPVKG